MNMERPHLTTPRLILRLGEPEDVPEILRYYQENRDHLTPWWPRWPSDFFTLEYLRRRVRQDAEEFAQDRSVRLFLFLLESPERVIGGINFNQIVRGAAQYCTVGYGLGQAEEGRGYMMEGLSAGIRYMFEERRLHRIMANYIPTNLRSAAVLKRLGFVVEGYARDYLFIQGCWQDHILTSLTNPHWQET
jgi:ribosomal-protein-alanine N-acetyltransferase